MTAPCTLDSFNEISSEIIKSYVTSLPQIKETRISRKQKFEFTFLYTIYS